MARRKLQSRAIKTKGEGTTGNTAHLNLSTTLEHVWRLKKQRDGAREALQGM